MIKVIEGKQTTGGQKKEDASKPLTVFRLILLGIRVVIAGLMIMIGMLGLLLPILPGWVMLIAGLALLYREIIFVLRKIRGRLLRNRHFKSVWEGAANLYRQIRNRFRRNDKIKL